MAELFDKFASMKAQSASIKPGQKFIRMFADWEFLLREEGYDDAAIEEIRQQIRDDWKDDDKRKFWHDFVAERSAFRHELIAMSRGITDRIKARMKLKEAA